MKFRKILVPLDGSESAEIVFPFVMSGVQLHGASVLLLHAIAPLHRSLSTSTSILGKIFEQVDSIAAVYLENHLRRSPLKRSRWSA